MGITSIKPTDIVGSLSAAHQQMVEIAKVIIKKSNVIIMDEPTSSLSEGEIEVLFKQIEILKKNNVAIIYITHRLKELNVIGNRVSVLRDGVLVNTKLMKDTDESSIVNSMVGRTITDYYNKTEHKIEEEEELRVEEKKKVHIYINLKVLELPQLGQQITPSSMTAFHFLLEVECNGLNSVANLATSLLDLETFQNPLAT